MEGFVYSLFDANKYRTATSSGDEIGTDDKPIMGFESGNKAALLMNFELPYLENRV